ncbi:MAG: flagellar hook-associated protein FlgL [Planctomycetota bacterium]|nr:flagellar hook-associated protein FlgL [Planctomycetota bacterium]
MSLRISNGYTFTQFLNGIQSNQYGLTRAQAQISSGLRIMRPSDDPTGTSRVISLNSRKSHNLSYSKSVADGRSRVDYGASVLQDSSELLTEIRSLIVQSMNGTLNDDDRASLSAEIAFLRDQMLELANSKLSGRHVFGGTSTGGAPFVESSAGGITKVSYFGNSAQQEIPVGEGVEMAINVAGSDIFSKNEATGTDFAGLTGAASGTTADSGTGFEYLTVQHDATLAPGLGALGVSLVNGGAGDEILGDQALVIDPIEGTVSINGGPAVKIPDVTSADAADVTVANPKGGELHLDFSGWAGAGGTTTVTGTGSVSLDGVNFTAIDFTETDLQLQNLGTGSVVHVDTTAITRSGEELVQFGGAVNMFDALQSIVDALDGEAGLEGGELNQRLNLGLEELDRNQSNLLGSIGVLGSRSVRMTNTLSRLEGQTLELEGMISELRDVDFSEAVLELTKAEQRLELVQMSGTRMISSSLLNFMR